MSKAWIKAAGIRAIKTAAQAFLATIGSSAVLSDVDWRVVLSTTIMAGVLSLATSLAGLPEVLLKISNNLTNSVFLSY